MAAAATPLGQALARIEHQRARLIGAGQAGGRAPPRRHHVQVRASGEDRYAPFGLMVEPGTATAGGKATEPAPAERAVPAAPRGEPLTDADRQFLAAYEQVRAALAADDLDAAARAARALPDGSGHADLRLRREALISTPHRVVAAGTMGAASWPRAPGKTPSRPS